MSAPVLIVDDHELVGAALLLSLRGEGFATELVCPRSAEAVLTAATGRAPGLVLLDLHLGRDAAGRPIDGTTLVAPLVDAGWQVLVLSGSSNHVGIGAALGAGAVAWVPKNAPLPALLAAVRAVRAGRPAMPVEQREQLVALARRRSAERAELATRLATLSDREREVLAQLAQGHRAQAVADHYVVSLSTVRTQIRAVLGKLGVSCQLEAVALYRRAAG